MAPRSQLEITTSSVIRLVKEEASYHRELEQQAERIRKVEAGESGDDENKEYLVKQEVCAHSSPRLHLRRGWADLYSDWLLKRPRR